MGRLMTLEEGAQQLSWGRGDLETWIAQPSSVGRRKAGPAGPGLLGRF